MRRGRSARIAIVAILVSLAVAPVASQNAAAPGEERIDDLPPGPGRDETFGLCAACHAYRLVSNQGMSRERWDETLTWMTERHNMPKLEGAERDLILSYLAAAHPPRRAGRGGYKNPFAE